MAIHLSLLVFLQNEDYTLWECFDSSFVLFDHVTQHGGSYFPNQGLILHPLPGSTVLTFRPPGKLLWVVNVIMYQKCLVHNRKSAIKNIYVFFSNTIDLIRVENRMNHSKTLGRPRHEIEPSKETLRQQSCRPGDLLTGTPVASPWPQISTQHWSLSSLTLTFVLFSYYQTWACVYSIFHL